MESPWRQGDASAGTCPRCRRIVATRFEYRTVELRGTRLRVSDVLVAVCAECDPMVSVPRQSIAQLREVSAGK